MLLLKRIVSKMPLLKGPELVKEIQRVDSEIESALNSAIRTLNGTILSQKPTPMEKGYSLSLSTGEIFVKYPDNFLTEVYIQKRGE